MNRALRWSLALVLASLAACTSELAVPTEPLRLLRADWNVAYVGEPFDGPLRPTGGLRPYRFEVIDGTLPPGMSVAAGRLVGTPTEVGRFAFTIQVQDGNLSQTLQRLELDVRPLPTPLVRIDAPRTELRAPVPLIVRVEDARGWRGARVAVQWDADAFELVAPPTAGDARLALFHEAGPGYLWIEVAALGAARNGAFDLGRFRLQPLTPPAQLSLELAAVSLYSGGEHLTTRTEGAPRPRPTPTMPPAAPGEAPGSAPGDVPTEPDDAASDNDDAASDNDDAASDNDADPDEAVPDEDEDAEEESP
jgi:hypothetical protein